MHYHFLQDVQHLRFEGVPPTGVKFGNDDLVLITTPDDPAKLLDGVLRPLVSKAHAKSSKQCPAHILVLNQYRRPAARKGETDVLTYMVMDRSFLFLEALWLVKDNAGTLGAGFAAAVDDDGRAIRRRWIPHSVVNFTARATQDETTFSRDELDLAIRYYQQLFEVMPKEVRPENRPRPMALIHASRIGRALYLEQAARESSDVGIKVAFMCMAFEAMFSISDDSVSKNVSRHVMCFLAGDGTEDSVRYRRTRRLYKYRSIVVHGTQLDEKHETEVRQVAVGADEDLRRTLVKMLNSERLLALFSKNDRVALDQYFYEELDPKE